MKGKGGVEAVVYHGEVVGQYDTIRRKTCTHTSPIDAGYQKPKRKVVGEQLELGGQRSCIVYYHQTSRIHAYIYDECTREGICDIHHVVIHTLKH